MKELTGGCFCDRVIEAVGKQWPLDLAAELTRERGRLIVAGYHQDGPRQVNMWLWNWRGLDVINAHERDPKVYVQGIREAVDAVASGRLDPGPLYTHVFPLEPAGRSPQRHARPAGRVPQSSGDVLMTQIPVEAAPAASPARPRLGFLGVGWIGRHRMQAILETGAVEVAAIADPSPEMAAEAGRLAPNATLVPTLDDLLDAGVDGVVIATPSALHAEQSIRALERGAAVFCQKPLGRTAAEARAVVDAARAADRLLGVDLSYRFTAGMRRIREVVRSGALGRVFAADLVFHNAYGPDKPWFYDPALSGGGCVMDLGVHLVDLALWTLGFPRDCRRLRQAVRGRRAVRPTPRPGGGLRGRHPGAGDGAAVRLACSWRLQAGCDAMISAAFYGTEGGRRCGTLTGLSMISSQSATRAPRARRLRPRRTRGAGARRRTGPRAWPQGSASPPPRSGWWTWPKRWTKSTADRSRIFRQANRLGRAVHLSQSRHEHGLEAGVRPGYPRWHGADDKGGVHPWRAELVNDGTEAAQGAAINFGNAILAQKDPLTDEARGVSVELARELGRKLGVPVELILFGVTGKVSMRQAGLGRSPSAIDPAARPRSRLRRLTLSSRGRTWCRRTPR